MSADTAVLAGGEREPMNTTTRNLGRRLGTLGLALLLALALAGDRGRAATVPAAIYGQDPLEILELKVRPNVVLVLDSSGSMVWTTSGDTNPRRGDHPASKMLQAKAVLGQVVADNQDKVNFMMSQYKQVGSGFDSGYSGAGVRRFQYTSTTAAPILRARGDTADRGFQSWQDIRTNWNQLYYDEQNGATARRLRRDCPGPVLPDGRGPRGRAHDGHERRDLQPRVDDEHVHRDLQLRHRRLHVQLELAPELRDQVGQHGQQHPGRPGGDLGTNRHGQRPLPVRDAVQPPVHEHHHQQLAGSHRRHGHDEGLLLRNAVRDVLPGGCGAPVERRDTAGAGRRHDLRPDLRPALQPRRVLRADGRRELRLELGHARALHVLGRANDVQHRLLPGLREQGRPPALRPGGHSQPGFADREVPRPGVPVQR